MTIKVGWLAAALLLGGVAFHLTAAEPEWNPANVKECDHACLVGIIQRYMDAIYKHDPKAVPRLAGDYRMTEQTEQMDVGEGMLWRSHCEPTSFNLYVGRPCSRASRASGADQDSRPQRADRRALESGSRTGSRDRAAMGSQCQRGGNSPADYAAPRGQ